MTHDKVSDFLAVRNRHIQGHEQLTASLWQLNALMTVAVMTEGLYTLPEKVLHSYFLIASDLIEKAETAAQTGLDELLH